MKKTVIMMVIALLTVVTVQATALTWGTSSSGYLYDSAGVIIPKSSTVQLVLVLLPSSGYDVATDDVATFGSRIVSTANTSTKTAGAVVGSLAGITSSGAIYQIYAKVNGVYYEVFDMSTSVVVASYTVSGVSTGTETITTYQPGASLPAHALQISSTAIEFVPEPTSLALLALGAASLGLRRSRKFRK